MGYKQIRSLARGMAILKYLNEKQAATVADIAEQTRIPRATAYRILDALAESGLVYRSPSSSNLFRLTGNIRQLGDRYIGD